MPEDEGAIYEVRSQRIFWLVNVGHSAKGVQGSVYKNSRRTFVTEKYFSKSIFCRLAVACRVTVQTSMRFFICKVVNLSFEIFENQICGDDIVHVKYSQLSHSDHFS